MYTIRQKIDFGNCTNILDIEREFKVSTRKGLNDFKKVLNNYPIGSHANDLYRFVFINGEYCSIDEEIADLIQFLNDNDFRTEYCCAGHRSEETKHNKQCQCYISFYETERVHRLFSFLFKELSGLEFEKFNDVSEVWLCSNAKYRQNEEHCKFLSRVHRREEIVINKRNSFFNRFSFENEYCLRFNYKANRRMQSLKEFEQLLISIGRNL